GTIDVDGWKYSSIREFTVKLNFHVACAFEFFEDNFVHPRTCFDQCSGDNRERSAFLDISCRTKEPFRTMKRQRVDAAGQNFPRMRHDRVMRARKTGD